MPGAFDRIDAQHKPKPKELTLEPPKVDDPCADPACQGGHLEYGPTSTASFGLRCDTCGKEPRR